MKNLIFFCVFFFLCDNLFSQESEPFYINGDFQLNLQTYNDDESIGAVAPDETLLLNSFSNLFFQKGNFKLGVRYEAYLNSLLDFDSRLPIFDPFLACVLAVVCFSGLKIESGIAKGLSKS